MTNVFDGTLACVVCCAGWNIDPFPFSHQAAGRMEVSPCMAVLCKEAELYD